MCFYPEGSRSRVRDAADLMGSNHSWELAQEICQEAQDLDLGISEIRGKCLQPVVLLHGCWQACQKHACISQRLQVIEWHINFASSVVFLTGDT